MIEGWDKTDLKNSIENIQKKDWFLSSAINTNYTILDNDKIKTLFVTTGSVNITITLPTAAENINRVLEIVKVDSANYYYMRIDGEGAETINGRAYVDVYAQYQGLRIKSDGTGWIILDYIRPYQKTYLYGNTYNGVLLDVTGANWTTHDGKFIPYQTIDGEFWLRFAIKGVGGGAAGTSLALTITGINIPGVFACYARVLSTNNWIVSHITGAVITLDAVPAMANDQVVVSGDTPIAAPNYGSVKPTWMD